MNLVINQVIVLFLIMAVGYYARKRNIIDESINKGLSNILINITLPLLIISSFNFDFSKEMLSNAILLTILSFAIHLILIILSKVLYLKFPKDKEKVMRSITIFSNCGFMGFPILESIYGEIGVFYASIFNIAFNVFIWTYGVMLFSGEKDLKSSIKSLKNPGLISVAIGLIIFIFGIKLPYPIYTTTKLVGSMTTPLSMLVVGANLADMKLREVISNYSIYYLSFIRLIAVPVIVYFSLKLLGINDLLVKICTILEAMPAAVLTTIISDKYGGNSSYASQGVFITTLLSIITIPILIVLIL